MIVAAVGNDGPASPPLYPAAYDGVVGVTAVDGKRRVLLEACRGKHRISPPRRRPHAAVAGQPEGFAVVRGTSFAAPIVAGELARGLREPDAANREQALARCAPQPSIWARGRDDIYGAGPVGLTW